MLPKKTIRDGMTSEDEFNILALEQTPSKAQRLFAAEHTTIKVRGVFSFYTVVSHCFMQCVVGENILELCCIVNFVGLTFKHTWQLLVK